MTKKSALTFILNDENKTNSYGFRVKNSGIDLSRIKANPVMLDSHIAGNSSVIGRWENIRIEGSQLLADAVFDDEDDHAKKIKGKVERGFISGASMGLGLLNAKWELIDDVPTLVMCEITEASIVSLPSNANALKLYDSTGKELTDEAVKLSLNANPFIKKQNMSKLKLSVATMLVLGLQNDQLEDVPALSASIEKLVSEYEAKKANLTAVTTERDALKVKLSAIEVAQATELVDTAVLAGKIAADKKEYFLSLAKENYDLAKNILDGIPAKRDLKATPPPSGGSTGFEAVKNVDDFEKLSHEQKLSFKQECPDQYLQIFS